VILDTSALLAILMNEPEAPFFLSEIDRSDTVRLSVASYLEAAIFVERRGDPVRRAMLDPFLEDLGIVLEPVTVTQIREARDAYRLFGKGQDPAGLNFGDCFTYALARFYNEPLLFKGNDFTRTDVMPAVKP
jgi:ribonuclease VapC